MGRSIPVLCLCLWLLIGGVAAQQQDKPQQPPPTPPPGGQPPPQQPRETPRAPEQERRQEIERPLFLAGKVILEDGNAPPEAVKVEMSCSGQVRYQIHTDSRGYFSFEVGDNRPYSVMDASVSGGRDQLSTFSRSTMMGRTDLSGCELRAVLPGFQSEIINLGQRSSLDNPDVGTILLRRQGGVSGTTVSLNTLKAPEKARKAYEKGRAELVKKKPNPQKAAQELEKAVAQYPEFAAAWALLGDARLAQADEQGAREAFQHALEADPQYLTPYLALASLEIKQSKWAETAQITGEVLKQNPFIGRAHFLHALANYQLGELKVAEESALEVKKTNEIQHYPVLFLILGDIHARKGDIPTAAVEFRRYLEFLPEAANAAQVRSMLLEWENKGLVKKD